MNVLGMRLQANQTAAVTAAAAAAAVTQAAV
jgi:hypothetical protein